MKKQIAESRDGRSETMQNNKRPVGRPDEGVIFKFNSAVPRDKTGGGAIALRHGPDIFYGEKQRSVISFSMICTTNDFHD